MAFKIRPCASLNKLKRFSDELRPKTRNDKKEKNGNIL